MSSASEALLTAAITVTLAGAVGYGIFRLISPRNEAANPLDLGRKWFAWMAMIVSFATLPPFFRLFNANSIAMWLLGLTVFGGLAFGFGWLYGRFIKFDTAGSGTSSGSGEARPQASNGDMASGSEPRIKRLGRYDIVGVLGKGELGVVYAGMDPRLHRKVAIKTILKSSCDEDTAKEYTMRFDREAQAVARLNHPNIVQVCDFGSEGDIAYIVMEFIQGKELKDFFDANERFDIKEIVHIMGELCDALHFSHEAGIIHRDIKPANVMIDTMGRVKLADFGVARITDAERSDREKTQAGAIVGTPAYMSPEQIEGGEIDRRTDIFSAGIILYQFLTGEKPFTGTSTWTIAKKILQEEPVMPSKLNTSISPLFDSIIAKALAKNMNARYQTAHDLGIALKNALEGRGEENGRTQENRTRESYSNTGPTGSGHPENWTHVANYFQILEIQPGATINEVKAAYKRRMQQYHPDKVASLGKELRDLAEAKSKEINEAYHAIVNVLST